MYGNRHQLNQAIYLRNMVRRQALERGGTPFTYQKVTHGWHPSLQPKEGELAGFGAAENGAPIANGGSVEVIPVPSVYEVGSGPELTAALVDREKRKAKALHALALRAFMKRRRGIPLTAREAQALARVGGNQGLRRWYEPQGIDIETVSDEGELVTLGPEEDVLASEALNGQLEGEKIGFTTVLLIAAVVGGGIFRLGRVL